MFIEVKYTVNIGIDCQQLEQCGVLLSDVTMCGNDNGADPHNTLA